MEKLDIIAKCKIEGNVIKLPKIQLDRKLYLEIAKTFNNVGGIWDKKMDGFVFKNNPYQYLQRLVDGEKINIKNEYQMFFTPPKLADTLVEIAGDLTNKSILEPSAGEGALIEAILRKKYNYDTLFYCEIFTENRFILKDKFDKYQNILYLAPFNHDFLNVNGRFDIIIANPPFSKNQDIDHILKMWELLNVNGKLVTIASKHWQFANDSKSKDFRNWIKNINAFTYDIDAGEFKESGTNISTCIITAIKK